MAAWAIHPKAVVQILMAPFVITRGQIDRGEVVRFRANAGYACLGHCLTDEPLALVSDVIEFRFADYPVGQYRTQLVGKAGCLLYIGRIRSVSGLQGHGDDDAFRQPGAFQLSECFERVQKRTDSGTVPVPLRGEVGNGYMTLAGTEFIVHLS